ncbi:beta-2 adrenergic receptor-like [Dendronephthya gigantea]|uniref:beta-2 adrenergic receptor-like n=1 Tax=Dendronephthya gigantea TaxID=151771 RepID=UPI0010694912|nr:beta-2 adrenergic receptor-like [Dendronephthya gigantea]
MNLSVEQDVFGTSCKIFGTTHFVVTKLPSDEIRVNHAAVIVLNVVLIIPTIMLNAVAIITIWNSSQMNSKPCYFVVVVQSAIDLAVGVFGIPLFVVFLLSAMGNMSNCFVATLAYRLTIVPIGLSTIALIAMTVERYIAILHPYSYISLMTKRKVMIIVLCGGALEFPVHVLSLSVHGLLHSYSSIKVVLSFFFIAIVYTRIYLVVRKLSRSKNRMHDSFSQENLTKRKSFLQEIKQAKSCFIVVICFFVLGVIPTPITRAVLQTPDQFEELEISVWAVTLSLCISSVDSVIFFWMKAMLRKEAVKMMNKICLI